MSRARLFGQRDYDEICRVSKKWRPLTSFGTQVSRTKKAYLVLTSAALPAALGERFACASTTVGAGVPVQLLVGQSRYILLLVYCKGTIPPNPASAEELLALPDAEVAKTYIFVAFRLSCPEAIY